MGKYIKKFDTHLDYEDFIETEDFIKPNVSYCVDNVEVHYSSVSNSELIVRYNAASNPTQLYMYMNQQGAPFTVLGADMFNKVEIDGTEVSIQDLDTAQGQYQLSAGEHIVKYTLKDPTMIGAEVDEHGMPSKIGALFAQMCPNIISVEIPNSVTNIGYGAFVGCANLTSVTMGNSVTSIGDGVFASCTNLTNITIPNGVISIGDDTFAGCNSLTNIIIPNSVTSIGNNTFDSCSSFTNMTIPSSVISIGDQAFQYCDSLTSVTIEATTPPTLGSNVFYSTGNCTIWVPVGTANTYKAASGWSDYASRIHEIGEVGR